MKLSSCPRTPRLRFRPLSCMRRSDPDFRVNIVVLGSCKQLLPKKCDNLIFVFLKRKILALIPLVHYLRFVRRIHYQDCRRGRDFLVPRVLKCVNTFSHTCEKETSVSLNTLDLWKAKMKNMTRKVSASSFPWFTTYVRYPSLGSWFTFDVWEFIIRILEV